MNEFFQRQKITKMKSKIMKKQIKILKVPSLQSSFQITQSACFSETSKLRTERSYRVETSKLLAQSREQLKNFRSMQNGFYVKKLYQRFEFMDRALFMLVVMNVMVIAVYAELQMKMIRPVIHADSITIVTKPDQIQKINYISQRLLWLNLVITLFTLLFSFLRHFLQIQFQSAQKDQTNHIHQLYQTIVILIQPYIFWDQCFMDIPLQNSNLYTPISIKFNLILVIFSIVKTLLILRYLLGNNFFRYFHIKSSKFFKPAFSRVSKMYNCEKSYTNIMKYLFKQNFLAFIGCFFLVSIIPSAYSLRIIESHFDGRFSFILDCFWFSLVSMSTIGYGDMFVMTPIGIAFDGFLMLSGVVIASLLVTSLKDIFTLSQRQKRALTLLQRLKNKGQLKELAAIFIGKSISRRWRQKKTRQTIPVSQQERIACREFNKLRLTFRCRKQKYLNLYRDMKNQFQSLKLQIRQILQICEDDIGIISQKYSLRLDRCSKRQRLITPEMKYYELVKAKCDRSRFGKPSKSPVVNQQTMNFLDPQSLNVSARNLLAEPLTNNTKHKRNFAKISYPIKKEQKVPLKDQWFIII